MAQNQHMTLDDFLTKPQPGFALPNEIFPPEPYPDANVGGSLPPTLPSTAAQYFSHPALKWLPPITALFSRPKGTLTSG